MPSYYFSAGGYVKECSKCKKEYRAETSVEDEAYKIFRKNFSPRRPRDCNDGLECTCYRCRTICTMKSKYGVDVQAILDQQNNVCAICETPIQFNTGTNSLSACVDHGHNEKETRGILCRSCNLGLGHFKDDPERMEKAIRYIRSWRYAPSEHNDSE